MSAFIVSTKTMNWIVTAILKGTDTFCGVPTSAADAGDRIGRILFTLNSEAVNYRYGDDEVVLEYRYRHQAHTAHPIQAHKSISCLLYQCSEGKQFETSQAYLELERFQNKLADNIITSLPAWQAAKWD